MEDFALQDLKRVSSTITFPQIFENTAYLAEHDDVIKIPHSSSVNEALSLIINSSQVDESLKQSSLIAIHASVENDHLNPLNAEGIINLSNKFGDERSFLLAFHSNDNSCLIYWKLNSKKIIFSMMCETHSDDEFFVFVRDFLMNSLRRGHDGINTACKFNDQNLNVHLDIHSLCDLREFNLLFLASEKGNAEVVKYLLKNGFNEVLSVEGKTAADLAYENKHFTILLDLLEENSRYPVTFDSQEASKELKDFLSLSLELRDAIKIKNNPKIEQILKENSNLRHFYDAKNNSVVTFAILEKNFEIYEVLLMQNVFFGPREDIDHIMDSLNQGEGRLLREIHAKHSQNADRHILILMSNSSIGHETTDASEKFNHIQRAYEFLNKIRHVQCILKTVAASQSFKITFDFNREFVRFLDPNSEPYCNGLFHINGRIFIGAKHLLDPEHEHEVFGTIAHELCHLAMCLVFKNYGNPFKVKDNVAVKEFQDVVDDCESKSGVEELVDVVFDCYPEERIPAEIIVRVPHMLASHAANPEKLEQCLKTFDPLMSYFEEKTMPCMEKALPIIQKETKKEIEKEARKKISNLKKIVWFLVAVIAFGIPALLWFTHTPNYTWKEIDEDSKEKILNSKVNYHHLDVLIRDLFPPESEFYEYLSSKHINEALNEDLTSLSCEINGNYDQHVNLQWMNLTDVFKEKILDSNFNFQSQVVKFPEISASLTPLNYLSSSDIKTLLSNGLVTIGNEIISHEKFFIPRSFKKSNLTLNSREVCELANQTKLFVLADEPGSGKSVVFKHLAKEMKEVMQEKWVVFIELKNHIELFEKMEKGKISVDENPATLLSSHFLDLNDFNRTLFEDLFANGNVVIFWDAVDEISPKYDNLMIKIGLNIKEKSQNIQFLSTRLQHAQKLVDKFKSEAFNLVEFSNEDRRVFLSNYLSNSTDLMEKVENFLFSVDDKHQKFNNPLLLIMISEIALQNRLSTSLNDFNKIYDTFVNMKLENIAKKGEQKISEALKAARSISIDKVHQIYALKSICGEIFQDYIDNKFINTSSLLLLMTEKTWEDDEVSSYGLMTIKSSTDVEFIHRTFAEYFVAQYFNQSIFQLKEVDLVSEDEMYKRLLLLLNVANENSKVIKNFIRGFIKKEGHSFHPIISKIIESKFNLFFNYFALEGTAELFLDFFESDEKVVHALLKINKYKDIDEWLKMEFSIDKSEDQLGFVLLYTWRLEKDGVVYLSNLIRNSLGIDQKNLTDLKEQKTLKNALNFISKILSPSEKRYLFINSLYLVHEDLKNEDESNFFWMEFKKALNTSDTHESLLKRNSKNETILMRAMYFESLYFTTELLKVMEENLSKDEIRSLLVLQDSSFKFSTFMYATSNQLTEILVKLVKFTQNHLSESQTKEVFLLKENNLYTMLQLAASHKKPDNFNYLAMIFKDSFSTKEIQEVILDGQNQTLPFFNLFFHYTSIETLKSAADFMEVIFNQNLSDLKKYLCREDGAGHTLFTQFQNDKKVQKKIEIFRKIVNDKEENYTKICKLD